MDCSPPGSFVYGIFQARILEGVAISFSRGSSWPRDWICVSCICRWILHCWATWEACVAHLLTCNFNQHFLNTSYVLVVVVILSLSHVRLCDLMDCSMPGSSVHGIFQARILQWVAMSFSRRSSQPRDWTQVSCIVGSCLSHQGSPELHELFVYFGD